MGKTDSSAKANPKMAAIKKKLENVIDLLEKKVLSAEEKGIDVTEASSILVEAREAIGSDKLKEAKMGATKAKKVLMERIKAWKEEDKTEVETESETEEEKKEETENETDKEKKEEMENETEEEKKEETENEADEDKKEETGNEADREKKEEMENETDDDRRKEAEETTDIAKEGDVSEEVSESKSDETVTEEEKGQFECPECGTLVAEIKTSCPGCGIEFEGREGEGAEEVETEDSREIAAEKEEETHVVSEGQEGEKSEDDAEPGESAEDAAEKELREKEEVREEIRKVKSILVEAKKEVSIQEEKALYSKATNLFREKEYSEARELARRITGNIEEKLAAAAEYKREIKEKIIDLQVFLANMENRGIDIGETWDTYAVLVNNYRNNEFDGIDEIIEKIKESSEMWKQYDDSLLAILQVRKEISDLKNIGVDVSRVVEMFQNTRGQLEARNYSGIPEALEEVSRKVEKKHFEYRKIQAEEDLRETQEIIEAAKKSEADIGEAEEIFADAREALANDDFPQAVSRSRDAREKLYPFYFELLMEQSKEIMVSAQEKEIDMEGFKDRMIRSQTLKEEGDYNTSIDMLEHLKIDMNNAVEYDECVKELQKIRKGLKRMSRDGFDILEAHDIMLSAREELECNNFEAVRGIIERCGDMAAEIERIGGVRRSLDNARRMLAELKDVGMEMSEFETSIESVEEIAREDEDRAREVLNSVSGIMVKLTEDYPPIITLIQRSQYYISKMEDYECNTAEVQKEFNELTRLFEARDLDNAKTLGERCVSLSQRSLEEYVTANTFLREAGPLMENVKKMGGTISGLEELRDKALSAMDEGSFENALRMAEECLDGSRNMKKDFLKMLGQIQITQSKINIAKNLGANIDEPVAYFKLIKQALDENDLEAVHENIELAQNSAEAISSGYKNTAQYIEKAQKILFSLKDRGAVLKKTEKKFNDIIPLLDTNDFEAATDLAKTVSREGEIVEQKYDYLMELIGIAQKRMSEAKQRGTNVRSVMSTFKKVGQLMDEGDYENGQEQMDSVLDSIENLTSLHDEAIRLLRLTWVKLSDAKAIGTDSKEAEKTLEEARMKIGTGEYETAINLAKESATNLVEKLKVI